MAVSKRLRYEVLRRDNHTCRYCGATAPDATLTVDHVTPVALGGSDDPGNLVAACAACNSGKSSAAADAAIVADVSSDALRWAAAIKQATASALADRERLTEIEKAVYAVFEDIPVPSYRGGGHAVDYFPADWFRSIGQFAAAGLAQVEMIDAALIAIARINKPDNLWRYFCGVCWSLIGERQAAAAALLRLPTPIAVSDPHCNDPWCLVHSAEKVCQGCDEPNCRWLCGFDQGRYAGMDVVGNRHAYSIEVHYALSGVCDGPAIDAFKASLAD